MGLYDTILFPKPIPCIGCSAPQESTQSHELGENLDTYGVGDVVAHCPVLTGILEERLYCGNCRRSDQKVFITIWHCLITGVFADQEEAERRLLEVDRADILNHLIRHQKEEKRLQRLLDSALSVVSEYAEYAKAEDKEAFFSRPFAAIGLSGFKEQLHLEDPLAGIVTHFRVQMGTSGQGHGIFS